MAFLLSVSSSIGKRILLVGLRHLDILDKDPSDFVDVAVGKRTTLEVRDVGLRVKKLVALLRLKLPPEIHISKARVTLLRVTFVLEFGVPQIIIEIEGVQLHARLLKDIEDDSQKVAKPKDDRRSRIRRKARSPRPRQDPDPDESLSDTSSDDGNEPIPTVDGLAKSFLKEEPPEEIKEMEEALYTQSQYLQDSTISSEDGEDEGSEGMGAGLGLPAVLRNLLNTALDRLRISAKHVDVQMAGDLPPDSTPLSTEPENHVVSVNFHIESVSIDSLNDAHAQVEFTPAEALSGGTSDSREGKRRMRIESVCARLISNAENFATLSRFSRSSSPVDVRSEVSASQRSTKHSSTSRTSDQPNDSKSEVGQMSSQLSRSEKSLERRSSSPGSHSGSSRLETSQLTVDEDRFADADIDEEVQHLQSSSDDLASSYIDQSHHPSLTDHLSQSDMFRDDGILEYAVDNGLFESQYDGQVDSLLPQSATWEEQGAEPVHSADEILPQASITSAMSPTNEDDTTGHQSSPSEPNVPLEASTDNLDMAQHTVTDVGRRSSGSSSTSSDVEDLAQSRLFTHDEAASMYMSAMSTGPLEASRQPHVPGGWDTASSSSRETIPKTAALPKPSANSPRDPDPLDDECETPRPASRTSTHSAQSEHVTQQNRKVYESSSHVAHSSTSGESDADGLRIAKPFFTINEIVIWFPLHLTEESSTQTYVDLEAHESKNQFPPAADLGEDSIFQEMPGSFSFYAESTASRRRTSTSEGVDTRKKQSTAKPKRPDTLPATPKTSLGIDVEVGTICGHTDVSSSRMIFQLMQKLMQAVGNSSHPTAKKETSKSRDEHALGSESLLTVSVKSFAFIWLERLMTESMTEGALPRPFVELEWNPRDGILRVGLEQLKLMAWNKMQESSAKLQIKQLAISSLGQEVIAFDSRKQSRGSIIGHPKGQSNDVELDYQRTSETRIRIATRPIQVTFDLQRLDDALSSFGGFSGVLELGNSITSNTSFHSPPSPPVPPRPRGVHFDRIPSPAIPPSSRSSSMPKIDIRFGDVSFLLRGKSCAIHLQTSPVKMAIRESNFRIRIAHIAMMGPYLDFPHDEAPFSTEIQDTTISFLFTPEELDLTNLLSMITPSKDPYEDDRDIVIETLLLQRRKGSVVRIEVADVGLYVSDSKSMQVLEGLGAEMARLSKVTRYLPEDDRPGILTLVSIQNFNTNIVVNERIGDLDVSCQMASFAHVGFPRLLATEVGRVVVKRSKEVLIDEVIPLPPQDQLPMIMARTVGDELEPVIRAKLFNICFEYHVSTLVDFLGLGNETFTEDVISGIASSVATVTGPPSPKTLSRQTSEVSNSPSPRFKALQVDILFRHCALGLNPRKLPSKGLFVLTDARFMGALPKQKEFFAELELRKASIHVIDNVERIGKQNISTPTPIARMNPLAVRSVDELKTRGFVSLSEISGAKAVVKINGDGKDQPQIVDVEFLNELFILGSCADSTKTLVDILNGLSPPMPRKTAQQYRTVVPLQEMMASFSGDAFSSAPAYEEAEGDEAFIMDDADRVADEVPTNLDFVGSFYNPDSLPSEEDIGDSMLGEDDLHTLATPPVVRQRGERGLLESFQEQYEVTEGEQDFDFNENYFGSESEVKGTARKWDSTKNQYHLSNEFKAPGSPLKVRIRDMNIIWDLFDGYDWPSTREKFQQAVDDLENRAEERRHRAGGPDEEEEEGDVEADFLFNSVWISIPVNEEKGALARKINHDIDDLVSETGSYATSTATRSTVRPRSATTRPKRNRVKLNRSKHYKIAFQLTGCDADLVVFPPGQDETQSSVNVRVRDLEIFDHIPTSTWKKFATSLDAPSEREMGRPMVNLELLTVKPVQDLAASELVLKVTVLPLRLHVDQDALDFITRFFEFKDDSIPETAEKGEQPFLQRVEVNTVKLKLHYKPKKVDYAGLRSGHTTEFMNFFILEDADITLRHAILYGVTSFDKLHKTLNDVWMPDVKRNQLPGVLAGLAPMRPLVNVGSGVRDLVVIPMREYKKDGRIVRSIQKGVLAFGKNTTSELARLGAKLAIGTQTVLEGAEGFLSPTSPGAHRGSSVDTEWEDVDPEASLADLPEQRAVSHYANQPIGVMAGLKGAARHLERDLLTAKDAIIAIPGEVMESGSAGGAAKVVMKRAPTVILKPGLGITKAVSNTLFGVSNALDKGSRRRIEDKYKDS